MVSGHTVGYRDWRIFVYILKDLEVVSDVLPEWAGGLGGFNYLLARPKFPDYKNIVNLNMFSSSTSARNMF